jgi:hypothetical protein
LRWKEIVAMTTTTAVTWPATNEIESAQYHVAEAHAALDELRVRFGAYECETLKAEEWASLPSLEAIGGMTQFLVFAEHDVGEMVEALEKIAAVQKQAAWMLGERGERDDAR